MNEEQQEPYESNVSEDQPEEVTEEASYQETDDAQPDISLEDLDLSVLEADEPEEQEAQSSESEEEPVYNFRMPEGYVVNEKSMEDILPLMKELHISPEKAQQLVDIHFREAARMRADDMEAQKQVIETWKKELRDDPDIGGSRLRSNLSYANRLLKEYASPELADILQNSGWDCNPHLIRFLIKAGKAMSEDHFVDASLRGNASPRTLEDLGNSLFSKSLSGSEY